jgi:hypothetical protein
MSKELILNKIKTLYKEYTTYKDFYEEYEEEVEEKKKGIASKLGDENFEKELEDFVLDAFVLKNVYNSDMSTIVDKIITYVNAARLIGVEEKVDSEILEFISRNKGQEKKPVFIIDGGKPVEVVEGFVDEQRKMIREQGNISKLIQRVSK